MSDPYIGEIKVISFTYPPRGWAFCNGQLLPINQNQALFSILGTMYGGNGQTNFALPNLQGRMPVHQGINQGTYVVGQAAGEVAHTLTINEMPSHVHPAVAQATASNPGVSPAGAIWATTGSAAFASAPNTTMNPLAVSTTGGSQPHNNQAPYLVLNYVIALVGIFPSRN
ncbi:MAG TPA: tail fiber protein [Jatrophihabitans sp.]|jgi:microcystin-dependent protein|uniref:phage tail protein n=1 Tax=Jatrophihabitans sp. TaxID=1932789 RepID=UPI002EEFEB42